MPESINNNDFKYKAFISYSHAADERLAPALQSALHRFAKPFYRLRAIRTFRDKTTLQLTDRLWPEIQQALADSEYFILMASPDAASSIWVQREISEWLDLHNGSTQNLLIALTDGRIEWDDSSKDFNWATTTALHDGLKNKFYEEPLYAHLEWARKAEDLSLRNPQFLEEVGRIGARLHNKPTDVMVGQDVRQHRVFKIVTALIIVLLLILTVAASGTAVYAFRKQKEAEVAAEREREAKESADKQREIAEAKTQEANYSSQLAKRAASFEREARRLAEEQRKFAKKNEIEAKKQLVESLISRGDAQGLAHRWFEAKSSFEEANKKLNELGNPIFLSDLGLWDLYHRSPPAINTLIGNEGAVSSIAFSPDGQMAISGDDKGNIIIWDANLGIEVRRIAAHARSVTNLVFLSDGKRFVSGGTDQTFKLWDVESKQPIRTFNGPHSKLIEKLNESLPKSGEPKPKSHSNIFDVAVSPDDCFILAGDLDGSLTLWDLKNGQLLKSFKGHQMIIKSIRFSPDGKLAVTASWDGEIKLWNTQTWNQILVYKDHSAPVNQAIFSPDGKKILSAGVDNIIREWDVGTGNTIRLFFGHNDNVNCVAFSPDGTRVVSGGQDNVLRLWDEKTGRELRSFYGHEEFIFDVAISPDGNLAMSAGGDGTVKSWNIGKEPELRSSDRDFTRMLTSISVSPDGNLALFGSQLSLIDFNGQPDNSMKLYDLATLKELRSFAGHDASVSSVAFSPDGRFALSGSEDKTLKLWDIATGEGIKTLKGHNGYVYSVAYSPNGHDAVSASADETVKLWDIRNGVEAYSFTGHKGNVYCVAFSPDGKYVASGGEDKILRLWDAQAKRLVHSFIGHTDAIRSIAFSPVEKIAISGSADKTFKLWDLNTGQNILTINQDQQGVTGLAFSADGQLIASSGYDGVLRLWKTHTGRLLRTFYDAEIKHDIAGFIFAHVSNVTFSPNGRQLICSNWDGTVKIYDFSMPALHREFESKLITAMNALRSNSNDAESMNTLGEWLALRGQPQRAMSVLNRARQLGAKDVSSLILARCYRELRQYEQAKAEYALALKRDEISELYARICINGIDLDKQSTYQQVDKLIEENSLEIQKNHKNAEAYQKRAIAYMARADQDKAYADFSEAFRLNPDLQPLSAMGMYVRAVQRAENENYEGAFSDLNQVIKQKDNVAVLAAAYNFRGYLFKIKKDNNAAIVDFTKAIENGSSFAKFYQNRADIYFDTNEWAKAIADFTMVIKLDPQERSSYTKRGFAYLQTDDLQKAEVDIKEANRLAPENEDAYYFLGLVYTKKHDLESAIEHFTRAIALNPEPLVFYTARGQAYAQKRDFQRARNDFTQVLKSQPDNEDALLKRGAINIEANDILGALTDCSRVMELKPKSEGGLNCRGFAYYKSGKLDLAIDEFSKSLSLNPKNYRSQYNIARSYSLRSATHSKDALGAAARVNDIRLALEHLEQAIVNGCSDWKQLDEDTDFDPIRDDPRFKQLMERTMESPRAQERQEFGEQFHAQRKEQSASLPNIRYKYFVDFLTELIASCRYQSQR